MHERKEPLGVESIAQTKTTALLAFRFTLPMAD